MLKNIRRLLEGNVSSVAFVVVVSIIINSLFAVIDPLILKLLIDEGLTKKDFRSFAYVAVVVVLFAIVMRASFWALGLMIQKLKNRITKTIALRMLSTFFKIPYAQICANEDGYFLSRIYDEPSKVAQGIINVGLDLAVKMATFVAAAAVAFYLDWRITTLLAFVVPLLYRLADSFGPKIRRTSKEENEAEARLREHLGAGVRAYTTARIFSLEKNVNASVQGKLDDFLNTLYARVKTATTYQTISAICLALAEATVLLAAGYEVVIGMLTIGGLFGFMNAFWKATGAAHGIVAQLPELAKFQGYLERLLEFEQQAIVDDTNGRTGGKRIALREVGFSYKEAAILENFAMTAEPGEKILIHGPNGSGKSTLAHVMIGLLEPTSGTIEQPLLRSISAQLSTASFIPGTLKQNVVYDDMTPEKKELFWQLVKDFKLEEKVDRESTTSFSQGERRKAQVLMALLKDADVYLFDEPLANVDAESKQKILDWQLERAKGKILISIMHGDEELYTHFDKVLKLSPPDEMTTTT